MTSVYRFLFKRSVEECAAPQEMLTNFEKTTAQNIKQKFLKQRLQTAMSKAVSQSRFAEREHIEATLNEIDVEDQTGVETSIGDGRLQTAIRKHANFLL
jgi:hypothetical protein